LSKNAIWEIKNQKDNFKLTLKIDYIPFTVDYEKVLADIESFYEREEKKNK
jgi:hypothetical protein